VRELPLPPSVDGDSVGQERASVVEDDNAVAQQGPPLLWTPCEGGGGPCPRGVSGSGARWGVGARAWSPAHHVVGAVHHLTANALGGDPTPPRRLRGFAVTRNS
jgi:hypothetical protein